MSVRKDPFVLGPGEGKTVPVPGHQVTYKIVATDTNGAFSMLEFELVGDGPPQHIHKNEEETFYVLEGEMKVLLGKRIISAKAGSFVFVPRGTVHAFCRAGQGPVKGLAMFSPAGLEKFFEEAVDMDVTDTEAYIARANALAEKYNMEIVGPPLEL